MKRSTQIYSLEQDKMFLFVPGNKYTISYEDELEIMGEIQRVYETPTIHTNELLKVFPQAKTIVKEQLRDLNKALISLRDYEKQIIDICYRKIDNVLKREETQEFFLELEINIPRKKIEAQIKQKEFMLRSVDIAESSTGLDISRAKQYPITQLIEFKGNVARCIFHSPDKNPSMYYYPRNNKVKCFSCGKLADAIDVVQQLQGCSLKEAVAYLNK
jgi:hypothetical protein